MATFFALRHSLHRGAADARGFYAVYAGLIAAAACLVLFGNDTMLGLLTDAVQTLAGVLLPSATVSSCCCCATIRRCWDLRVNGPWLNLFTGAVIWVLVMLSMILTVATVFTGIGAETILLILGVGTALGILGYAVLAFRQRATGAPTPNAPTLQVTARTARASRMPPLETLAHRG